MSDHVNDFLQRLETGSVLDPNAALVPHGERPCPICGQQMVVDEEEGIQTDVCPQHGVWLDLGELRTIISRVRSQEIRTHDRAVRTAKKDGLTKGALFGVWGFLMD